MNSNSYSQRLTRLKKNKRICKLLYLLYTILPIVMFICYPVMVITKAFMGFDTDFWLIVTIPAATLLLITVIRKAVNRQRPYEKYATPSLFGRDGKGQSFPSRHTASAYIIAMSGFLLSPILAAVLLIVATTIGITRILAGVHFISDVVAGMLISICIGTIFFIII